MVNVKDNKSKDESKKWTKRRPSLRMTNYKNSG